MLDNIRAHSLKVAHVATWVAEKAVLNMPSIDVQTIRASALLHDISKTYSIRFGGNHAQSGAVWALKETGNPAIAQGVYHHVFWPYPVDLHKYFLPLCVLYADKRVAHDSIVNINSRFHDLLKRYGKTEEIRQRITVTHEQVVEVENALQIITGEEIHENSFDSGRLV
ncbi:MAG: HDIG domain-containing metalloprotein [Desulfovibrio sp.]